MKEFYIVSVSHTCKDNSYILLWAEDNRGYAYGLDKAGKYSEEIVRSMLDYYNNGKETIAIPCDVIQRLASEPDNKSDIKGLIVRHLKSNWDEIIKNVIEEPLNKPQIKYKKVLKIA